MSLYLQKVPELKMDQESIWSLYNNIISLYNIYDI